MNILAKCNKKSKPVIEKYVEFSFFCDTTHSDSLIVINTKTIVTPLFVQPFASRVNRTPFLENAQDCLHWISDKKGQ